VTFSLSRIPLNNFGVSQLFKINCNSNRRETRAQIGQKEKPKTSLDTKTEKPPVFFYENRKPDVKKQKIPPTAMNTKTKKIKSFVTKTEKPS